MNACFIPRGSRNNNCGDGIGASVVRIRPFVLLSPTYHEDSRRDWTRSPTSRVSLIASFLLAPSPFIALLRRGCCCSRALMAALTRLLRASATPSSNCLYSAVVRRGLWSLSSEADRKPPSSPPLGPFPLRTDQKERNVQWVFLGCPGVGKGTYAGRLSRLLGVPHIATGDLVREELSSSGSLADELSGIVNQGKLVSDEIIISLLSKRLEEGEAKGESGFIIDGFPRTLRQAEILEGVTDIDLVINLKLPEDVLLKKCLGRRICSHCGGNYNVACIDIKGENGKPGIYMAPLPPPPECASKLITRADDTEEVVKERLRIYNEKSRPVEEFYRRRGKLLEFDLPGGIPETWPKLLRALNLEDHDSKQSAAA